MKKTLAILIVIFVVGIGFAGKPKRLNEKEKKQIVILQNEIGRYQALILQRQILIQYIRGEISFGIEPVKKAKPKKVRKKKEKKKEKK